MAALHRAHAMALIDASVATQTLPASTSPIKCRLYTVVGTASAAGTEVSGGSYGSVTVTFSASTNADPPVAVSSVLASYTSMPACTVVAVELWDSAGTPKRLWWGLLAASKVLNAGDTFQIASGSLTCSLA
jgi:hypothetical protein